MSEWIPGQSHGKIPKMISEEILEGQVFFQELYVKFLEWNFRINPGGISKAIPEEYFRMNPWKIIYY